MEEEGEVVTGLTLEGRVEEAVVRGEERRVEMVAECGEGKEEEKGEEGGVEREEKMEEEEEEEGEAGEVVLALGLCLRLCSYE